MKQLLLVGEDSLCCELGIKLVQAAMPGWTLSGQPINTRGVSKLLASLPRYAAQAMHVHPVLCVADTDQHCPVSILKDHLPQHSPRSLLLRLAVPEAESWVLADKDAFAHFFQVSVKSLPSQPEMLADPKAEVLRLARMSKIRRIREEVASPGRPHRQGVGYNAHLSTLVREQWDVEKARVSARSLDRAVERLRDFAAG